MNDSKTTGAKTTGAIGFVILLTVGIFLDKSNLTNTDYLLVGVCLLLNFIGIAVGALGDVVGELLEVKREEKNQ
jgi:hypothetical protein